MPARPSTAEFIPARALPATLRTPRLLIIEDEADLSALLQLHLSELPAEVCTAADGEQGLQLALAQSWDLIVLDLRLPRLGGLDVCREIRARGRYVPILMLTARMTELDRVLGLELGADDYLTKPFSMLELQARIKALLRRASHFDRAAAAPHAEDGAVMEAGPLRLDRSRRRATLAGLELVLTPREWEILQHIAQGQSNSDIADQLSLSKATIQNYVSNIYAKLGIETRAEAMLYAMRHKLVDINDVLDEQ